ncbi:MAG: hypothetical protein R2822_25565 [Spirosomataceae bacterium]
MMFLLFLWQEVRASFRCRKVNFKQIVEVTAATVKKVPMIFEWVGVFQRRLPLPK